MDRRIKRLFDLLAGGLLLCITAPLMAAIALLVKVDSPGPVFFRQQRVGEGGRLFRMIKFRSMVADAEMRESNLLQVTSGGACFVKTPQDERVTRLGRFLRRTSLDELPQLFNVLTGDMSLVGPRPELPELARRYAAWQSRRLSVPQGMTGWWQVNGRMNRADPRQRLQDDLFYIDNFSLWLDLQILWKTVLAVIRGEGAF